MLEPLRGNSRLIDIVAGDRLRPGDVISAKVVSIEGPGRFRLLWNGRGLLAESHLQLKSGQIIQARVEMSSGKVRLRLLADAAAHTRTSGMAGPFTSGKSVLSLLSASMLRAGLPLPGDNEAIRRAALLERTKGPRIRMARLYSELISKGADPTAGFLEALESLFSRYRDDGDGPDPRGRPRQFELPVPEELADEARNADREPLLALLGAVEGRDGRWVFGKSRKALGDREVGLTWKIREGRVPALALTVRDGQRVFEFLLEGRDDIRMAVYANNEALVSEEHWRSFRERLALMNVHVDDTISPMDESDGFTPGADEVIRELESRS